MSIKWFDTNQTFFPCFLHKIFKYPKKDITIIRTDFKPSQPAITCKARHVLLDCIKVIKDNLQTPPIDIRRNWYIGLRTKKKNGKKLNDLNINGQVMLYQKKEKKPKKVSADKSHIPSWSDGVAILNLLNVNSRPKRTINGKDENGKKSKKHLRVDSANYAWENCQ